MVTKNAVFMRSVAFRKRLFHYPNCEDMADMAEFFLYESGAMDAVPEELRDYIDFEAYGNNLYTSGTFIETNHGIYEIGW